MTYYYSCPNLWGCSLQGSHCTSSWCLRTTALCRGGAVESDACNLHLPRSSLLSRTIACDCELGRKTTFVPSDTSYSKRKRSALGSYRSQIDGRHGIAVLLAMIACQAAPNLVQRSSVALLSHHVHTVPPPQSQRSLAHSSIVSLTLPASEVRSESP